MRPRPFAAATVLLLVLLPAPPASAAPGPTGFVPHIVSRAEWGADETLGMVGGRPAETAPPQPVPPKPPAAPAEPSERERLCGEAFRNSPHEFQSEQRETHNASGNAYVWPRAYSPKVRLIVLHHTGEGEHSDEEGHGEGNGNEADREERSGIEHVRAIYQWHAVHNGWGDIGYHFLIDREGVIYEGRAGGNGVVGAHAYCWNTGTIGVAFLGNFRDDDPTEAQMKSGRWLLAELAREYRIRPLGQTTFHGKRLPTIAMHRDLNDTECPGGHLASLVPTIRTMVARADFTTPILPHIAVAERPRTPSAPSRERNALTPVGTTRLRLPPRGTAKVQVYFTALEDAVKPGGRIAELARSDASIGVWQGDRGNRRRVRDALTATEAVARGESRTISLTLLAPPGDGVFTLRAGDIEFTLEVGGRRMRER